MLVIKWKNWTALLPVKIISFLLVPTLLTVALTGIYQLARYGRDLELTFARLDNNSYFDRTNLSWWQISSLAKLLIYEDEEAIREGRYIQVQAVGGEDEYGDRYYDAYDHGEPEADAAEEVTVDEAGEEATITVVEPKTRVDPAQQYLLHDALWESPTYVEASELEWYLRERINDQLYEWRQLQDDLAQWEAAGLLYHVTNGTRTLSNVKNTSEAFFTGLPVYRIVRDGYSEQSSLSRYWNYQSPYMTGIHIYAGFAQESVDDFNIRASREQAALQQGIAVPLCALAGAFVALVVFLLGVGRRFGDRRSLRLSVLDRPWLDVSFGMLLIYLVILAYMFSELSYYLFYDYGYYDFPMERMPSAGQTTVLFGAFAAACAVPALWWTGSLFKRFKDNSWWRHTLCYRLIQLCVGFGRSMWSNVHLAGKALAVSGAIILAAVFCAVFPPLLLVFAVAVTVLLLRFAHRLLLLQHGAELAVQGESYPPMLALRGTLGGIATAVGNVSAGISQAVDARTKSERMKTELITNVSHDIRTPLTSLITYTDLLKNEGLNSEKAAEYLDVLVQKAQRLKGLTDELFEAAKASSGNVDVHPETLDIAALIRQSLGEHEARISESGLQFVLDLPEHAMVVADGRLLSRVMENLLSNVFKYALPGSRVYVDVSNQATMVCMELKNISATQLNMDPSALTERFTRGDTARSGDGSGLGLAIVQSFVEAMGGRFVLAIDGDLFKASIYLSPTSPDSESGVGT